MGAYALLRAGRFGSHRYTAWYPARASSILPQFGAPHAAAPSVNAEAYGSKCFACPRLRSTVSGGSESRGDHDGFDRAVHRVGGGVGKSQYAAIVRPRIGRLPASLD